MRLHMDAGVRGACWAIAVFASLVPAYAAPRVTYYLNCRHNSEQCHFFNRPKDELDKHAVKGTDPAADPEFSTLVDVIVGSKVMFSGTVLKIETDLDCSKYDWNVVTQTEESSSVLIYGPADIAANCDKRDAKTFLLHLTLPVHVVWAEVDGDWYGGKDSFHKPPSPVSPPSRDCDNNDVPANIDPHTGKPAPSIPAIGINLCDRRYWLGWIYSTGWVYTRLTQPGTGQGTIGYSPVVGNSGTLKLSYDVQINPSTKLGLSEKHLPAWIGLLFVFEKDSTQKANLDSLTTALSYEVHAAANGNLFPSRTDCESGGAGPPPRCQTHRLKFRSPEVQFRSGIEFAPTTPHDLNTVQAELLKIPIVEDIRRQPSSLTVYPIVGLEEVQHVQTHLVGENGSQLRRVAGADASLRWPFQVTHNFLGDKPITIEYSYRTRWLSNSEPWTDVENGGTEILTTKRRAYERASFNAPISSYLQFKVTVQHGSLPPDFHRLGYSLQLGLSFSDPGSVEH